MIKVWFGLLYFLISFSGFPQKVSVDLSSCSAMMNIIDDLRKGQSKNEVSKHLDSILNTRPMVVMFKHYNRPYRPDHLPKDVFKRMILSLRYPEEYKLGEKERADQMLDYWKLFYERPDFYRKSVIQLQQADLEYLINKAVQYAQNWLPLTMKIPGFDFYIIPNGGSGAFAIDSSQGHDFFQLPRDSVTGLVKLNQLIANIAHESHHLGINIDYPGNLSKQDSLAFRFLSVFIAEGTATKFVDNAPGGFVPTINKKHAINFENQTYTLWKHYTVIEDSLFNELFKTFDKIYTGSFSEDSINYSIRTYWLSGAIKGPAYFVGSELYGAVYYSYGRKGLFEAMTNPAKLFQMYNYSIERTAKLKKCIPVPEDLIEHFRKMK
jgi:hypothetical protein